MLARYAAKAAEVGVGASTLRRWVKDFAEHGPAGLADDRRRRRRQPLAGADPRWLDTARQVLADRTDASKPTQDLVLAEIAARLDAEHGAAAVPVPSPTRARILLRETGISSEEAVMKSAPSTLPEEPPNGLTCGIDWARDDHAVAVVDARGRQVHRCVIEHSAAGLRALTGMLGKRGVGEVAIERPDGPVV
jgi:transposase